jgi:hypothetical protein
MGIGHVAVGLALKRADRRINVGWLIFAALLPDFLLGWFVLAGWESYAAPPDYRTAHYLLFTFPWSHGLLADLVWALTGGMLVWALARRPPAAEAVAIAVLSHFLLDGVAHVRGLPLVGTEGPVFGLGLWRHLSLELSTEAGMAAVGLWIYLSAVKTGASKRGVGMAIYIAALTVFLIAGQAGTTELPERGGLIASWLAVTPVMSAIAFWLDRRKPAGAKQAL